MDEQRYHMWITETENNDNYISMARPQNYGSWYNNNPCNSWKRPGKQGSCEIDLSNSIKVEASAESNAFNKDISGSCISGPNTSGDASTSVEIDATQVSVFVVPVFDSYNSLVPSIGNYKLAMDDRNLDIQVNKDGSYINGQKMEEQVLEDGTRVFVYKNNEVKKYEKKAEGKQA
ncbi:hypothetical protein [Tissierella sp.]|uniref:hypothetical protein n=1 Tax=Tissierella sp. TaxID=41274 RepID=UPI0028641E9E|nr:hypothetical protein [Tissierella sp.]MDR7856529.1 hypothetical protein [Tissierella sp.]